MKKLPNWATTITPLSKVIALLMFATFPVLAFWFGYNYRDSLRPESVESLLLTNNPDNMPKTPNTTYKCYFENTSSNLLGYGFSSITKDDENIICNYFIERAIVNKVLNFDIKIQLLGKENNYIFGSIESPFLIKVSKTNAEIIFSKSDAILCSDVDNRNIKNLIKQCYEQSAEKLTLRDTK
jgi:hypothetical protein